MKRNAVAQRGYDGHKEKGFVAEMRGETPRGAGHEQLEQDAVGPLTVSNDALLVNGSDSQFREIVHNFLAFSARVEQIRSCFGAYIGLSGVQYTILMTIRQLQGRDGVGIRAIADHLAFSPPFVTNETTKLVKRGVVNKVRHPDDARRVRLTVSSDGTALLSRLAPLQREINNVLFAPITPENFHAVWAIAQALRNNSQEAVLLSDYLIGRGGTDEYDNNSGEGNPG